jgi:hypothetical protein
MCFKDKKTAEIRCNQGQISAKIRDCPGGMRYYPAFGVKSRLVAPFGRFFGV